MSRVLQGDTYVHTFSVLPGFQIISNYHERHHFFVTSSHALSHSPIRGPGASERVWGFVRTSHREGNQLPFWRTCRDSYFSTPFPRR